MKEQGEHNTAISFREVYKKMEIEAAFKIIANQFTNKHEVAFLGQAFEKRPHESRRVGKPRMSWTGITVAELWGELKEHNARYRFTASDYKNHRKARASKQYAEEDST